jgi:hypothetical protein
VRETGVRPRDSDAAAGVGKERGCESPTAEYREQVFYHDLIADSQGFSTVALANEPLGLGVYVRARRAELPYFTQWKMMGRGTYVVGLEPGSCLVEGRAKERASGRVFFLEPGEQREFLLECGILDGGAELQSFAKEHHLQ